MRAPRGRRRVPEAAGASFIIIFGQVECARNSCCTRLASEGGDSGIGEMNDGAGAGSPRGWGAGRSSRRRLCLVASAAPPSSPGASNYLGSRTRGAPGGSRARCRRSPRSP